MANLPPGGTQPGPPRRSPVQGVTRPYTWMTRHPRIMDSTYDRQERSRPVSRPPSSPIIEEAPSHTACRLRNGKAKRPPGISVKFNREAALKHPADMTEPPHFERTDGSYTNY